VLYLVTMEVRIPPDADQQLVERLKAAERQRAQELQRSGEWRHPVAGGRALCQRQHL
jgi:muconolactone D-isomerase